MDPNPIADLCSDAIRMLDAALGPRACGAVVSGNALLGFRGVAAHESPYDLTRRALVSPMMDRMGYGGPSYRLDDVEGFGGTVMAMVPMNRPVDPSIVEVLAFMRGRGVGRGMATDGFAWILLERGPLGPRVRGVADLRPFYIEALDESRFKAAVPVDPSEARRFLEMFGRPSPEGVAERDDLVGEGVDGVGHPGHERVVGVRDGGAVRGGDDDALLLHDLQGVPHPVLGEAGHLGQADEPDGLVGPDGPQDGYVALQQLEVLAQGVHRVLRVRQLSALRVKISRNVEGKGVGGPISGRTTSACPTCCSCPTIPGRRNRSSRAPSARPPRPCTSCSS
ncbi:MAG: hypothetical protein Q4Q58_06505 [Thermoplasmata archaeon]|nr:hypothetical protein [Thermoplasmata archaeon]